MHGDCGSARGSGLMFQYFINRGWSDGLPMLAPTEPRSMR